ncbi:TPA: type I-F CRISPR-associated endonuclease Cas1 [Pseudomonas aeruginosa]|nr:type I-F CRISPR-associated endonuclease Cas1 [Pseudomonas aeruginosa]
MLPSHKEGIVYLEHCRLQVDDERLCLVRAKDALEKFWSIPHAATLSILLGPGTSLTQAAAKFLGREGVMVAFVGGEGAPVYYASQNEYRPTAYLQAWVKSWAEQGTRLAMAKVFQQARVNMLRRTSSVFTELKGCELAIERFENEMVAASSASKIMSEEGVLAKVLYKACALSSRTEGFKRDHQSDDLANKFLTTGNYLAYGLAAASLWLLGIPHSLPINHGSTRRGGLVFDLADVVKDACVMPTAFRSAALDDERAEFRAKCIAVLDKYNALETMINTVKDACACHSN